MNRRTDIVLKTWEGQFLRSTGATSFFIPFQYQNGEAVLRDSDRCRQTIWSGANHDRVIFVSSAHDSAINSSSFVLHLNRILLRLNILTVAALRPLQNLRPAEMGEIRFLTRCEL